VSKSLLNQETDARFWAQTHYKIGKPLDLRDVTDRSMAKIWQDILLTVQKEDREHRLRVTFNDPEVVALLRDAVHATDATKAHIAAAAIAPDAKTADGHIRAATDASAAAGSAARGAAARQPPTVSPIVVQASADESARALGQPLPPPVVWQLPPDHPAMASPAARPELPVQAIVQPLPLGTPSPHAPALAPDTSPPPARDVLAEAKAREAPAVAVAVHEDHARTRRGRSPAPTPAGTTPPKALAALRGGAQDVARKAPADFVGVTLSPANDWVVSTFPDASSAAAWYGDFTNAPTAFQYAAYYDKTDDASWPSPVEETLGTREEIPVRVQVRSTPRATDDGGGGIAVPLVVGGLAVGLLAFAASRGSGGSGAEGGV
jgi:hypothetical protein